MHMCMQYGNTSSVHIHEAPAIIPLRYQHFIAFDYALVGGALEAYVVFVVCVCVYVFHVHFSATARN